MTTPISPDATFKLGSGVIEVTSDTSSLREDLRRGVTTATRNEKIVLPVELDRDLHRKLQADLKKATANFPEIELGADASDADKEIEKLRVELTELSDKEIGVDIEAKDAIAEVTRIRRELDRLSAETTTVRVKADTATAVVKLAAIEMHIAKINESRAEPKIVPKIEPDIKPPDPKIGEIAANRFAQSFSKDMSTALSRFDIATPISAQMVGSILSIAAVTPIATSAVLAFGSSLGLAASSSAAAIPALLGVGAGVGGLVLAFSRVKTALKDYADTSGMTAEQAKKANEKFQKSLDKLSPAGRDFVLSLVDMRSELKKFQGAAEQAVLPAFTKALADVRTLLPDLNTYMQQFGVWTSVAVADLGSFVQSPAFRSQLKTIMGENEQAAKMFALGLDPIPGILTSIAEAASPLVPRFATAFESGMRMLSVWTENRRESGQLADFFTRAGDEASKWGQIVGNTVVGIARLFGYAAGEGRSLSSSILEITQRFNEWSGTESARNGVIATFEYVRNIDYVRILAIASAVTSLSLAVKSFGVAQGLAGIASSLASLGPIGLAIGATATVVIGLAAALGYLYVSSTPVREAINGIVSDVRDQLGPVFEAYRSIIVNRVAPAIDAVLGGALRGLRGFLADDLLPNLRQMYDEYIPKLEKAFTTVSNAVKDNKTEIMQLLGGGKELLGWVVSGIPKFATFAGVLVGIVAGSISALISVIGTAIDVVHGIGTALSWAGDTAVDAWDKTRGFLTRVFSSVSSAARDVGDAFIWVGDKSREAWNAASGFIGKVFGGVAKGASEAKDAVFSAFGWIYDKVSGVLSGIWDFAAPILSSAGEFLYALFDIVRQVFDGITSWVGQVLSNSFNVAVDTVKSIFVGAFNWLDDITGGRIRGLIYAVMSGISAIGSGISAGVDWISRTWDAGWSWVSSRASAAWTMITVAVVSGVNSVGSGISAGVDWISRTWGAGVDWVSRTWDAGWSWVSDKTNSAMNSVRGTVSSGLGAVSGFFSGMWDSVRGGWDRSWNWLSDRASGAVNGIKSIAGGIKDGFSSAVNGIPRAIVGGINSMIDMVNGAIGTVNKILPDKLDLPALGHINVPAGYATGGRIVGVGTGTSDSIPIMASNGEFVLRAAAVSALQNSYGAGFLEFLNSYDVSGDPSATRLQPRRYADGGLISKTQQFIRSTDPLPYVWGAVGPNAYDCSGLVGEVWARLTGNRSFNRYFTTLDLPGAGGFRPGRGTFTIGLSPEHVVGNLGGLPFEAKGSQYGILVGPGARSVDSMPNQYYLPSMGDQFFSEGGGGLFSDLVGRMITKTFDPIKNRLPHPGGIADPLINGLFEQIVSGVRAVKFDQGGPLHPGPTLSINRTGRDEQVLTPEEISDLKYAAASKKGDTYQFGPGSITLDASKIKDVEELIDMINGLVSSSRRYGG